MITIYFIKFHFLKTVFLECLHVSDVGKQLTEGDSKIEQDVFSSQLFSCFRISNSIEFLSQ